MQWTPRSSQAWTCYVCSFLLSDYLALTTLVSGIADLRLSTFAHALLRVLLPQQLLTCRDLLIVSLLITTPFIAIEIIVSLADVRS